MSRQILSYADLGPITSVTTPIPVSASPHTKSPGETHSNGPPRKRPRTDGDSSASAIPSNESSGTINSPNISRSANGNSGAGRGNARKGKKPQRPGNPSGVPWTQHWDAQSNFDSDGRVANTLHYEDDGPSGSGPRNGHVSQQPHSTTTSKNRGMGVSNGSASRAMPPPSFIGPVVPVSNAKVSSATSTETSTNFTASQRSLKGKDSRPAKKPKRGEALPFAQEEEWDDSALVDAWNAAEEEYRVMNGGKKWRLEPVKHSTLWHDEPYSEEVTDMETSDYDDDAQDVEIVTGAIVEQTYEAGPGLGLPIPVGTTRSQIMEEAFRKAQEASYTAGYWTAVYQMHASQNDPSPTRPKAEAEEKVGDDLAADGGEEEGMYEDEEEEEDAADDSVGFLPTQR